MSVEVRPNGRVTIVAVVAFQLRSGTDADTRRLRIVSAAGDLCHGPGVIPSPGRLLRSAAVSDTVVVRDVSSARSPVPNAIGDLTARARQCSRRARSRGGTRDWV